MLQDKLREYLEQADVVKTLNADLKDAQQTHEEYDELEKITKAGKNLRDKIANTTEVALIKEKRDTAKERMELLKDILFGEMAEAGETEVTYNGKKAKIVNKMQIEKEK
jgi:hypothetical protein